MGCRIDPAGEWSDPIFLDTPGIDPSLYFDEDGSSYYVGTCEEGIYVQSIDLQEGKVTGPRHVLWKGRAEVSRKVLIFTKKTDGII